MNWSVSELQVALAAMLCQDVDFRWRHRLLLENSTFLIHCGGWKNIQYVKKKRRGMGRGGGGGGTLSGICPYQKQNSLDKMRTVSSS